MCIYVVLYVLEGKVSFTPRVDFFFSLLRSSIKEKNVKFQNRNHSFSDLLPHSKKFSCKVNFLREKKAGSRKLKEKQRARRERGTELERRDDTHYE